MFPPVSQRLVEALAATDFNVRLGRDIIREQMSESKRIEGFDEIVRETDFVDSVYFSEDPRRQKEYEIYTDAVEMLASLPINAEVLELCCGTGSVSVRLAQKGHRVVGVDCSNEMIRLAKRRAASSSVDVEFLCGDIRDSLGAGFDAVLHLDMSFGFCKEDAITVFNNVYTCLNDNGIYIVETWHKPSENVTGWRVAPQKVNFALEYEYDIEKGLLVSRLHAKGRDGLPRDWSSDLCVYSSDEWRKMLIGTGFEVTGISADLGKNSIHKDSKTIVVIARKGSNLSYDGVAK